MKWQFQLVDESVALIVNDEQKGVVTDLKAAKDSILFLKVKLEIKCVMLDMTKCVNDGIRGRSDLIDKWLPLVRGDMPSSSDESPLSSYTDEFTSSDESNQDLSTLSDTPVMLKPSKSAAVITTGKGTTDREVEECFLGTFDVHIRNLVAPAPEHGTRLLDHDHVQYLADSFQEKATGQLAILVGMVPAGCEPASLSSKDVANVETLGGNHTREALQSLMKRGLYTKETVRMHLYRPMSTTAALMLGWQHNAILQERQKTLTFMDKVRLMRQTREDGPMLAKDVRRWKEKLSLIFNMKDSRRLQASYSHHLQMAEFGPDLWQMVETASHKHAISEKFFRQLMRINSTRLIAECLQILIEEGQTLFKKKVKQLIDDGNTRSKKTKKTPADTVMQAWEESEPVSADCIPSTPTQPTVSSADYDDLLERYNAIQKEASELKRKNQLLEEQLLQFRNSAKGMGSVRQENQTTTDDPEPKRQKRQKAEFEKGQDVEAFWRYDSGVEEWLPAKVLQTYTDERYLDQICSDSLHCSPVTNGECRSNKCLCISDYFQTGTGSSGTCTKRYLDQRCSDNSHCSPVNNGECRSGICLCKSDYFQTGTGSSGTCTKRYLDQRCSDNSHCSLVTNGECRSGICLCKSDYFQTGTGSSGTCTKRYLDQMCSDNSHCSLVTNGECRSGICLCKSDYFQTRTGSSGTCTKRYLDQRCSDNSHCSLVTNGECRSGICLCKSDYFQTGTGSSGTCTKRDLGESCSQTDQCSDADTSCSTTCQCLSEFYDTNGGVVGGSCSAKVSLGGNCPMPSANVPGGATCKDSNAVCTQDGNSYTCICTSQYYDNMMSTDRRCVLKVELGYTCPRSDACRPSTAECVGSVCICKSDYYDDNTDSFLNGQCRNRKNLEATCTYVQPFNTDQCSDANALCTGSGSSYYCTCNNGYYKNGSTCVANKALGAECFGIVNECSDPNAMCPGSGPRVCTCKTGYYRYNPTGENKDDCENVNQLQVTGITFSNIQTAQFTVSWAPPSGDKASFINEYTVEWRPQDNTVGGDSKTITAHSPQTITGLTSGEAYEVKIISKNTQTQPGTTRSTFSSKTQASKPSVTSGIDFQNSEKDASDGRITVTWFVPSGKVSGYKAKLLDGTAELAAKDPTYTSTTFSTSELKNGYRYTITIQAKSQQLENGQVVLGEIYSALFKTTPKKPNRPTDGACSTPTDSSISLAWSPPLVPNGDLVQYQIDVYRSRNFLKTEQTGSIDTSYTIVGLEPGTQYTFYVYTENEVGNSVSSDSVTSGCKTKTKMSDKPTNLQITEITSRGFTISWSKPNSTHSQENYGYILQIKDRPESCVEEIYFKCSDCTGRFQATQSDDLCDDIGQTVSQKTATELGDEVSYHAVLYPDITYTVQVAATNDAGIGYLAEMRVLTLEEAPQKPDIVTFSEVQSDSLKVTWTIADPRPGKITFEVTLDADEPAMDKVISVEGFENRSAVVTGLQEYWNYLVQVKASTSIDSNVSSSKPATTLPAAPGNVSDFKAIDAPNDNYRKLQILWKIPDILERNGEIANYSFTHNTTGEYKSLVFNQNADVDYQYSETVDVLPEEYYSFEVYATNVQNQKGDITTTMKEAPAGVPVNIEETLQVDVIAFNQNIERQPRQIAVTIVREFFEESTNGIIRTTGILACAEDCDFTRIKTLSDFNTANTWQAASQQGFTFYRVTPPDWLLDLQPDPGLSVRKKRTISAKEFIVGSEDCTNVSKDEYCNGPLAPNTDIILLAVSCTNGGCLLSREYGPFSTAQESTVRECSCNCSTQTMITGVVLGLIIVIVSIYAGYATILMRRYRKSKDTDDMPKVNKSKGQGPLYVNESFMVGVVAEDRPDRPTTVRDSETEYSRLDENTREEQTTYETIHAM